MKKTAVLLFLLASACASATELVYTPINPSFGGNPLNGNFLLQKAQSQNSFSEERPTLSFVDKFQEALERNIINSLTRRIADGDLVDGIYNTGEFLVEITTGTDGSVIVNITNLDTGEVTIITIPVIGG
ncbi:MAG: curli production assembly protein CsgF [Rheinheimera sp.]|uniref:curli assembly protein CsgF n=1 Tax=Arsukibacterium sp. UBA3155 TaxID=1946058 RepID=UPI000C962B17|nr:curli assembly protein CsgF [Arsukibacterium sp. UBA3155]MAD76982.1 curli production assembly protein CsgF [Rheinheimera sp.]|tara:strand:- start:41371 stop:41757 length:387 start_codon:yes stop_codon:yes gene_type:complete